MLNFYKIAYWTGIKPWERAAAQEAKRISALFEREEIERTPPFGKALDLGCGTGMQAVELARRGWQVTGVDLEPKALRDAEDRAQKAGVEVRFIRGDVTRLAETGVGGGFEFVLDFGLFHGLADMQRQAMGREVDAATTRGATMLMIAWAPGRRAPLPRGADAGEIQAAFPDWKIIAEDLIPVDRLPRPMRNTRPCFYRLRRD